MASLSVLYRRFKKLVFFLIIFYLVRSYYLRKKRGDSGDKRIEGAPERKRITDGREQKSETKSKVSEEDESDDESENEEEERKIKVKENNEKVVVSLEATETAVEEESKKDQKIEQDMSLSMTENIKVPKDTNFIDIEKTEIVNEIIKDSEIEAKSREVPVINNIEVIPTITNDVKFQLSEQDHKIIEEVLEEVPIVSKLNENIVDSEVKSQQPQESLVNMVENAIEEPEKLAAIIEDIIIPAKEVNEVVENPEKVEITVDDSTESLEETSVVVDEISEELIEPPVEEVIEEVVEPQSNVAEEIAKPIVEEIVEAALETIAEPTTTEEIIEEAKVKPEVVKPEVVKPEVIETVTESIKSEVNVLPTGENVSEPKEPIVEEVEEEKEKSSTDQEPQNIELLISEIEKVVNESESENSFIEEKEIEEEVVVKPKPVNTADIVGHEEIIYEGDVDGDDDGEWIDEDDDGEWVDEDEDEDEEVEKEEEEEKEKADVKSEINKRQSLLLNTSIPKEILNSLMTPMSSTNSTRTFPLPTPAPANDKPKVLPDDILERIFREVDPQTLWVLRNTSIKTRNIVDNILKETFEQYDLSMDPLYFDVTSKDNLGLVLDTLDLPPFALAMLLHEVLKLDSKHIGYAFGQMFRVPSKIDIEYLTDVIVETLNILKTKKDVDIAAVMHGLQHYYCFNHSELDFYQLFDSIEMTPEEVARFIQNHYHFILSKSLPPLLQALDVDEVFVAEMCKAYANGDMDAFARIISKVPVRYVRTSVHPADIQGDRVVVVNENGEDVIVVLNNDNEEEKEHQGRGKAPTGDDEEWVEDDDEENREDTIIVENNQSFSLFIGRILRFLNMSTKDVASFFKYLPEYCSYDEDEILEGLNWTEEQIDEMRRIMKEENDKIAKKMRELSKLIIQRRMSISSGIGSPLNGSPSISSPSNRSFH